MLLFYSNSHGRKFTNFTSVAARPLGSALQFVDLDLGPEFYYRVDDHLTKAGHQEVAKRIEALLLK